MASPRDDAGAHARRQIERAAERAERQADRAADRARRHAERETRRAARHEPGEVDKGIRTEEQFSLDGVRRVQIEQTAGKLTVRPCAEGEAPGVVASGSKSAPRLEVRRDGDRLVVEVRMLKGWLFRRQQGATTLVRLAPGLESVRVEVGFGDVLVRDLQAGRVDIDVGAGEIRTVRLDSDLKVDVGAGKVSVMEHRGPARGNTGTGDLVIDIAEAVTGEYQADTGIGRAEVRLPPGCQVTAKLSSGLGRSRNEYPSGGEGPKVEVKLNTGVGEAVLKVRDPRPATAEGEIPGSTAKPQRPGRAAPAMRWREAEQLRVLQMLEQGKVTAQEAADLIAALQGASPIPEGEGEDGDD